MAFSESESPQRIWERTEDFMVVDFRRKNPGTFPKDHRADESVLKVIQNLFSEISSALTLESSNFPRTPVRSYDISVQYSARV